LKSVAVSHVSHSVALVLQVLHLSAAEHGTASTLDLSTVNDAGGPKPSGIVAVVAQNFFVASSGLGASQYSVPPETIVHSVQELISAGHARQFRAALQLVSRLIVFATLVSGFIPSPTGTFV
jgi:hypothetical protein